MFWTIPCRVVRLEQLMERVMAQIDDLTAGLTALGTDIDAALAHVATLEQQLQAAQGQGIDLSGPLATVAALRAKLEGASDSAAQTVSNAQAS